VIFQGAPELPAQRLWVWRFLYPPIRIVILGLIRVDVDGREHLPERGAFILASNHQNWKDPPFIVFGLDRDVRFMAKIQAFDYPVLGFLLRGIGSFPVRRGEGDRRALVTALKVLAAGRVLGFFPEGHRSADGSLLRAKPGIAFLAERVPDVPIVPLAVMGSKRSLVGLALGGSVRLRIGPAFHVRDLSDEERRDAQAQADAVMRRVAALVPAEMRGPYR